MRAASSAAFVANLALASSSCAFFLASFSRLRMSSSLSLVPMAFLADSSAAASTWERKKKGGRKKKDRKYRNGGEKSIRYKKKKNTERGAEKKKKEMQMLDSNKKKIKTYSKTSTWCNYTTRNMLKMVAGSLQIQPQKQQTKKNKKNTCIVIHACTAIRTHSNKYRHTNNYTKFKKGIEMKNKSDRLTSTGGWKSENK